MRHVVSKGHGRTRDVVGLGGVAGRRPGNGETSLPRRKPEMIAALGVGGRRATCPRLLKTDQFTANDLGILDRLFRPLNEDPAFDFHAANELDRDLGGFTGSQGYLGDGVVCPGIIRTATPHVYVDRSLVQPVDGKTAL